MSLDYQAAITISAQYTGKDAVNAANNDLNKLSGTSKGLNQELQSLIKDGFKGLVAVFAIEKIREFTTSIIDLGDHLHDLAIKTGIGVDTLSSLKTAAELGGLSFEGFEKGLKKFTVNIAEAAAGSEKQQNAFKAIGVSLADLKTKSPDEILGKVADKFAATENPAVKAAIAVRLFGKAGVDLIPLLNEGSEAITKYGVKVGDEFANQADHFNDALVLMKVNSQQFGVNLLSGALPALNDLADVFVELGTKGKASKEEFSFLGETIRQLGVVGITAGEGLLALFDLVSTGITQMIFAVKLLIDEFLNLGQVGSAAFKLISGDISGAQKAFSNFTKQATTDYKSFIDAANNTGADFFKKTEERAKRTGDIIARLEKGSSIFGDGTSATSEIKKPKPTGDISLPEEGYKRESEALKKLQEDLKATTLEYNLQAESIDLTKSELEKKKIAIEENKKAEKEVASFQSATLKQAYLETTQQIIAQKQALIDLKDQQKQSFGNGIKEGLKEYSEGLKDVAASSKKLFLDAFKGIEDALVKFVQTGKLNFSDLAKAIEADLIRIAIRQAVIAPLLGLAGSFFTPAAATATPAVASANGNVISSSGVMSLSRYAAGGIATAPQLALFGEAGPEAFVPLPDGRSIPVSFKGAAGGGGTNVNVIVNVNSDGSTDQNSASASDQGKQLGNLISTAVVNEIMKQKRAGGLLA